MDCRYPLNHLVEAVLTSTHNLCFVEAILTSIHNLCFEQKYENYPKNLSENFHFFVVKFSVYLNRYVFVMRFKMSSVEFAQRVIKVKVSPWHRPGKIHCWNQHLLSLAWLFIQVKMKAYLYATFSVLFYGDSLFVEAGGEGAFFLLATKGHCRWLRIIVAH